MAPVSVSVVIPRMTGGDSAVFQAAVSQYLENAGISFEILTPQEPDHGTAMRSAISESRGDIVAIPAPRSAGLDAIGNAIAMVDGGVAEIAEPLVVIEGRHVDEEPSIRKRFGVAFE